MPKSDGPISDWGPQLSAFPSNSDPANFEGRTAVVGTTKGIFTNGAWVDAFASSGGSGGNSWTPNKTSGITNQNDRNFTKNTGTGSGWDQAVWSNEGYVDGCYTTFRVADVAGALMAGLNSDPQTDAVYTSIDYAFYFSAGVVYVYESGQPAAATNVAFTANSICTITYDGAFIRYYVDANLIRQVARPRGGALFFDSSFSLEGAKLLDVRFGPMASGGPGVGPRIIQGVINANGTIASGSGFTCTRQALGKYRIDFTQPFAGPINPHLNDVSDAIAAGKHVALAGSMSSWNDGTNLQVWVSNATSAAYYDGPFSFIVIDGALSQITSNTTQWSPLTLAANFSIYSSGFNQPGYYKDHTGRVYLRGQIRPAGTYAAGNTLTTLPPGFRPAKLETFATAQNGDSGLVYVDPSGAITHQSPTVANGNISFDGVSFMAADGPYALGMPQVGFKAQSSVVALPTLAAGSLGKIGGTWTPSHDTHAGYSAANTRFVIPAGMGGLWRFKGAIAMTTANSGSPDFLDVAVYRNGAPSDPANRSAFAAGAWGTQTETNVDLNVVPGDIIELYGMCRNNNGYAFLSGFRV